MHEWSIIDCKKFIFDERLLSTCNKCNVTVIISMRILKPYKTTHYYYDKNGTTGVNGFVPETCEEVKMQFLLI